MHASAKAKPPLAVRRILVVVIGATVVSLVVWLLNPFGLESAEAVHWIRGTTWQNPNLSREANEQLRIEKLKQLGDASITVLVHDLRGRNEIHSNARFDRLLRWIPQRWRSILPKSETRVHSRRGAAWLAGELGPQARRTVPELLAMLKDGDPAERCEAAVALGKIQLRSPEALVALKKSQNDAIAAVRQVSLVASWQLSHDEETVSRLDSVLRNTNQNRFEYTSEDTYRALAALGSHGNRFVPALATGMTNTPDLQQKALAAKVLWHIQRTPEPAFYILHLLTNQSVQSSEPVSLPWLRFAMRDLGDIPEIQRALGN